MAVAGLGWAFAVPVYSWSTYCGAPDSDCLIGQWFVGPLFIVPLLIGLAGLFMVGRSLRGAPHAEAT